MRRQIKKLLTFPTAFIPYYLSIPWVRFVYGNNPPRMGTASRKNFLRNRIIYLLQKKYHVEIEQMKAEAENECADMLSEHPNIIWSCWFQGLDSAPEIVKLCHNSLVDSLGPNYEIILLTEDNWKDYVTLPDDIIKKREQGIIGDAHFSDMLRLALLNEHGGTWIDATVLCTKAPPPPVYVE